MQACELKRNKVDSFHEHTVRTKDPMDTESLYNHKDLDSPHILHNLKR